MEIENTEDPTMRHHTRMSMARLFAAYTALYAFRVCFMRLCFFIVELSDFAAELSDKVDPINLVFISINFAAVAGLIAIPLLLDKTKLSVFPGAGRTALYVCIALSAVAAIASYFTDMYAMLALQFAASFFSSGALAICLRRLVGCVSSVRGIGLFIGGSNAIVMICIILLFFTSSVEIPPEIMLIIICSFLAVAALCFEKESAGHEPDEDVPGLTGYQWRFTPQILRLAVLLMCIYVLVCGLFDGFYFFDDVLSEIPALLSFSLFDVFVLMLYIATGYIFCRVSTQAAVICGFALFCLGQSMTFFSNTDFLAYPYVIFSNTGDIVLEVYLVSLPIAYCVLAGRRLGILPGLGYILLFAGYALTSILFEFIPENLYTAVLGIMLLLSVTAIIIVTYLMNVDKTNRFRHLEAEFNKQFGSGDENQFNAVRQKLKTSALIPLTSRELEVAELTVLGIKRKNIADMLFIQSSTVDSHRISIYNKFGVHTRSELLEVLDRT